jgi:predicted enzyme related to lactoylglutathione lyase
MFAANISVMTTTVLGLRTCIYRVSDLDAATQWYTRVFQTEPYFNEPFYVGFNIGGYELGLHPVEGAVLNGENVETYWGVEDVALVFQNMLDLGAKAHQTPNEVGGGIIVATVKDPWNNLIGLIHNPHFKLT